MTDLRPLAEADAEDLVAHAQEHLDSIRHAFDGLAEVAEHLVDRDSIAVVVYELHAILNGWAAKGRPAPARLVLDAFKQALMENAGERAFDVPTLGRFETKKSTPRKNWQWDDLIPKVVAAGMKERRIIDPDAGEVEPEGVAVARAMRECLSFSSAKVTGLKARSIDVADYCDEGEATWDVVLPAPQAVA